MDLENKIFNTSYYDFEALALKVFRFQYDQNTVYKSYVDLIHKNPEEINSIERIPFLPIRFFKSHQVMTGDFSPELIFESSGTTSMQPGHHYVKSEVLYKRSFLKGFQMYYGNPQDYVILGMLPGYLEQPKSSLVYMVNELIQRSSHRGSGFYLDDFRKLYQVIVSNEIAEIPTLLVGVTFALMDFAEQFPMRLSSTIIMETGGMKGRRKEITRQEVHYYLKKQMGVGQIHAEYGMSELLSQAYSEKTGIYHPVPWMKVVTRDPGDPLETHTGAHSGLLNIIDLANLHSCSFLATDDIGKVYHNGSFEVLGRSDNADLRGCSLMVV